MHAALFHLLCSEGAADADEGRHARLTVPRERGGASAGRLEGTSVAQCLQDDVARADLHNLPLVVLQEIFEHQKKQ